MCDRIWWKNLWAALLTCCLAASAGCSHKEVANSVSNEIKVPLAKGDYTDSLRSLGTVTPEQSPKYPLVRLSGLARAPDGSFLVGDVSEGRVSWFEADGRLRMRIGRSGTGPGEFEEPRLPRFLPDGRLLVADPGARRLHVFSSTGGLVRTVSLAKVGFVGDMEVLSGGRLLFALQGGSGGKEVLVLTDSLANPIRRYLPIGDVLPDGAAAHPAWESIEANFMTVRNDTAFVVRSLSDSLWIVDLGTGSIRSLRLVVPGYIKPSLPETFEPGVKGLFKWSSGFHLAVTIHATSRGLYIPFVKGVLNYGDPTVLVVQRDGRWMAFDTRQPLLHASGELLTVLAEPDADTVTLALYTDAR
jgi:hypothetical protein